MSGWSSLVSEGLSFGLDAVDGLGWIRGGATLGGQKEIRKDVGDED